jgi:prolyl-tRNA synthetase
VAVIALHGDDKGLILPPKIAPIQIVIIPIFKEDINEILPTCEEVAKLLQDAGFGVKIDMDPKTPGEKFYIWEIKGVPLRFEIGPKEVAGGFITAVRRDLGKREKIEIQELVPKVNKILDQIQDNLLSKVQKFYEEVIVEIRDINELESRINEGKVAVIHWCRSGECADELKKVEGIELVGSLPGKQELGNCIVCGNPTETKSYVARTY